jgi:dihydrofolate reductase
MENSQNAKISAIAAHSIGNQVIGKDGATPWNIPEDMNHFKRVTAGHTVIMGRKTHKAIGFPLKNRTNIVLSRQTDFHAEGAIVTNSQEEALSIAQAKESEEIFIIGGEEIYRLFLPQTERLYLTIVRKFVEGDAYFPSYRDIFTREINRTECRTQETPFTFLTLERP